MCTLTVLAEAGRWTLTMNRDELRERHEGGLLSRASGNGRLCYPLDALSGGTWLGLNDSGVALCLLNRYGAHAPAAPRSRGGIIPAALEQGGAAELRDFLLALDCRPYPPFDLYQLGGGDLRHYRWEGATLEERRLSPAPWFMCSSSLLLPETVIPYRRRLFEERAPLAARAPDPAAAILRDFHLHQDPADREHSVLTERERSHTKSVSQVRLTADSISLDYYPEILERRGGKPLGCQMAIGRGSGPCYSQAEG